MTVASPEQQIEQLVVQAKQALAREQYFQAERLANDALQLASLERDFGRMAEIVGPLQEARRRRLAPALSASTITIIDVPIPSEEELDISPGCYLVRPPLVGADARRVRLDAQSREIPVAVLCREPPDQLGLCPIVALGSSVTVRTKVDPPADPDHPDLPWFVEAMEALGDWAIEALDPELDIDRRVDALMARVEAIPDHERLHQCLADACREAHDVFSAEGSRPPKSRPKTKVRP